MNLIPYRGLLIRENNPADKVVLRQCADNYGSFRYTPRSRVLDFGVYVGGFARMALEHDIEEYLGIEADAENYMVAKQNLKALKTPTLGKKIIHAAASVSLEETVTLYQTNTAQKYNCGTVAVDSGNLGHRPIHTIVKNVNIREVIADFRPTHVKMDIEGAEIQWLKDIGGEIPAHIEEIAIELHRASHIHDLSKRGILRNILEDFEIVHVDPMIAFEDRVKTKIDIPEFNLRQTGSLLAIDVFLRRK